MSVEEAKLKGKSPKDRHVTVSIDTNVLKSHPKTNGSRFTHIADLNDMEEVEMEVEDSSVEEGAKASEALSKDSIGATKRNLTAK